MPLPFRSKVLQKSFAKDLLAIRGDWEDRVAHYEGIREPNRVAILSASAGATVMLGGMGSWLIDKISDAEAMLPAGDGGTRPDRVVQFTHALASSRSVEAAYRVVSWGLIAEFGAFF